MVRKHESEGNPRGIRVGLNRCVNLNKRSFFEMPDLTEWNALCARCESVYDQYGPEPIPTFLSDDPCAVFAATDVAQNVGRFVVFILWLKKQPFSFGWYALLRKTYPDLFQECLVRLSLL